MGASISKLNSAVAWHVQYACCSNPSSCFSTWIAPSLCFSTRMAALISGLACMRSNAQLALQPGQAQETGTRPHRQGANARQHTAIPSTAQPAPIVLTSDDESASEADRTPQAVRRPLPQLAPVVPAPSMGNEDDDDQMGYDELTDNAEVPMRARRHILDESDDEQSEPEAHATPLALLHGQQEAEQQHVTSGAAAGLAGSASPTPSLDVKTDVERAMNAGPGLSDSAEQPAEQPAEEWRCRNLAEIQERVLQANEADFPLQCAARVRFQQGTGKLQFKDPVTHEPLPAFYLGAEMTDDELAVPAGIGHRPLCQLLGEHWCSHHAHAPARLHLTASQLLQWTTCHQLQAFLDFLFNFAFQPKGQMCQEIDHGTMSATADTTA